MSLARAPMLSSKRGMTARQANDLPERFSKANVSFVPPAGWTDASLVMFIAPGPPPVPNITMSRDPMRPGDTLRAHADHKLLRLARTVPGFDILESGAMHVGGRPAIFFRSTYLRGEERFEETSIMIDPSQDADRRAILFSAVAPADVAEAVRPLIASFLDSVCFDDGPELHAHSSPRPMPVPPEPSRTGPGSDGAIPMIPMPGLRPNR